MNDSPGFVIGIGIFLMLLLIGCMLIDIRDTQREQTIALKAIAHFAVDRR